MPLDPRLVFTPDWFKNEFIGVAVEQWIGVGALVAIFLVATFVLRLLITLYVRHVVSSTNRDFWNQERKRLNRPLLLLALAATVLIGFPVLDFDSDIEGVVNLIARVFGSIAVVLLLFRAIDIFADTLRQRAETTETKFDDQLVPIVRTALKIFAVTVGGLFVLANLDGNLIRQKLNDFGQCLNPQGRLILSGLLERDATGLCRSQVVRDLPMTLLQDVAKGEWRCLVFGGDPMNPPGTL